MTGVVLSLDSFGVLLMFPSVSRFVPRGFAEPGNRSILWEGILFSLKRLVGDTPWSPHFSLKYRTVCTGLWRQGSS